ncbi:hypothetical protein AB1Y20_015562 [Prymnesium parvum]|uniref:Aminotransferase class I/classII large domain-containing protein n=1 Tax=Prymnesium parvum TaxID=97485 RepID=A0AB34K1A8_PRYPA
MEAPFTPHLSRRAAGLPPNAFTDLLPLMSDPTVAVLSQGVPPSSTFPLSSATFCLSDGSSVSLDAARMALAQRYPQFAWEELRDWLHRHVATLHRPPCAGWAVCLAAGSTSSLHILFSALADRGDCVLVEEHTFTAALDILASAGIRAVPVALDEHGLLPASLDAQCAALAAEGLSPRFLYTIPVGQNPTGSRLPEARYAEVYAICRAWGLSIIEDDPYFYQQHRADDDGDGEVPGLARLGKSYLSVDEDGRVVRLDSFSKILAPGFRIGWVSGAPAFVRLYDAHAFISSQWGCSLSMMLLSQLLAQEGWFEARVRELQRTLRARCRALVRAAREHLGERVSFRTPPAGMFLWCTFNGTPPSTRELIAAMRQHGVCVLPSSFTSATKTDSCASVRLSFVLDDAQLDEAALRLGQLVDQVEARAGDAS